MARFWAGAFTGRQGELLASDRRFSGDVVAFGSLGACRAIVTLIIWFSHFRNAIRKAPDHNRADAGTDENSSGSPA